MNNSLTPEEWKKQKSTVTTAQGKIQVENVHEGCISRAALIEKVEGMRKTYEGREDLGAQFCRGILDDLLTHLRGEELCIFHKDKNCCAYDEKIRRESGIHKETECCSKCIESYGCLYNGDCICHKPRPEELLNQIDKQVGGALRALGGDTTRTEETEKGYESAKIYDAFDNWIGMRETRYLSAETEKEGASFSGRENDVSDEEMAGDAFNFRIRSDSTLPHDQLYIESGGKRYEFKIVREPRKENPTPQSREQSTEEKRERLAYLLSKDAEAHPQGHKLCPMCYEIRILNRELGEKTNQ